MTIEEKAKAYDEALERAKAYHRNELAGSRKEMTEYIFPELRESDDEKIRKALIDGVSQIRCKGDVTREQMITYLEKQKEQPISAEEVLAKAGLKPYKDGNQWCILAGDNIQEGICGFGDTIDEALYQFLLEVLEMQKEQKPISFSEPYNPDDYEVVTEGNATSLKRKEQKSIEDVIKDITKNKESAIKFLKSAGIMDDNGELAEIYRSEQKPVDYDHEMWKNCEANFEGGKKEVIDHPEKYGLQKHAEWSKEDKTMLNNLIWAVHMKSISPLDEMDDRSNYERYEKFLTSLPGRFDLKPEQEWSEEDKAMIERLIRHTQKEFDELCNDRYGHQEIISDLKESCRERMNWLENRLKSLRPNKQD